MVATTGSRGAGIGGGYQGAGGTITINGGTVMATGCDGAGIGGGNQGAGGTITINGGEVTAKAKSTGDIGHEGGAGIGGGGEGAGGKITITGGKVTAQGSTLAAGIGGGGVGAGGEIIISGGIVTAMALHAYRGAKGIGGGADGAQSGTFSTQKAGGTPGNAFIITTSIGDQASINAWNGVIFQQDEGKSTYSGKLYGNNITLPEGTITIPSGHTLTIGEGQTLTVTDKTTLINEGTITGKGNIEGKNIPHKLTVENVTVKDVAYCGKPVGPVVMYEVTELVVDEDYTLEYAGGSEHTNVAENISVTITPKGKNYWGDPVTKTFNITKATPKADDFIFTANDVTYDGTNKKVTVTWKESITSGGNISNIQYYAEGETDALADAPIKAGTYTAKITVEDGTNYTSIADLSGEEGEPWKFTIQPKQVTVTPKEGQVLFAGWKSEAVECTLEGLIATDESKGYTVSGLEVEPQEDEISCVFTGNNLSLNGEGADNYTLSLAGTVPVTVYPTTADGVEETVQNGPITSSWTNQDVVLLLPKGFVFTDEKGTVKDGETLELSEEGQPLVYYLKLEGSGDGPFEKKLPIGIDKKSPEIESSTVNYLTFTMQASDALSGIASVKVGEKVLTKDVSTGFYSYTGTAGKHTAVVTDNAGNFIEQEFTLTNPPTFSINLVQTHGGTIEADYEAAAAGTLVTLTYREHANYDFVGWTVTKTGGDETVTVDGNNTFIMPNHVVTVSAHFRYDPPYVPVYYTVTLPAVEGATTDPAAGDYEVLDRHNFSFRIVLDEDYDLSVPVVTTDRGSVLTPSSNGTYTLRAVNRDTEIRISGIVKNPDPVANEAIRAETIEVRGGEGCLFLHLGMRREVGVYTFTGSLLRFAEVAPGDSRWALPTGNYIVRIDGKSYKVAVR